MLTLSEVIEATGGELRGAPARDQTGHLRFSRVVVDSRAVPGGALFVALKGQQHDGHAFVAQALAHGAAGALVERVPRDCQWALDEGAEVDGPPLVVVPSTADALQHMARYALDRQAGLEIVGITGSLGKTTTKEVVAGVLSARWPRERKNAATAATPAARDSVQCWAYAPTRTGNAPQATANHTSLCSTPPKSSRL